MGIRSFAGAAVKLITSTSSDELRAHAAEIRQRLATARASAAGRTRDAQQADSFEESATIQKEIDRLNWEISRDEIRLADVEQRLAETISHERAEALRRHHAAVIAATAKLRKAVVAAATVQADVIRLRESAKQELGEHVVERAIPLTTYRGLLLPDLVAQWEIELDRITAPRSPGRAPPPGIEYYIGQNSHFANRAPPLPPKPATGRVGANVRIDRYGATAPVALEPSTLPKRLPDDTGPLAAGHVRVRVLREGYPDAAGGYSATGRRIQLPRATAEAAAKNGAVELLETESAK